jgi:hypothetical protein
MQMIKNGVLTAPSGFWKLSKAEKESICNGAGPKGYGYLVPDTMWGLNCTPCFDIHDYCYHIWSDISGKEVADRLMLNNLYIWIDEKSNQSWWTGWLRWARKRRAYKYYLAVKIGGNWFYN